ncbi:hypothetical protein AU467_19040 [Mesorhizobium loti]|uniref:Uncharacterized protein n=1 Tax=Rhizobium loti TaxID=381 RepID=A0A101KTY0_RHILI|nr:hypothetical protein AU467_19040 [Mesorhizobium loti]
MVGQPHGPLLVEQGVFREHAVQRAAELVDDARMHAPVDPAREIAAGDALADGKAHDAIADRRHLAGAVAQRNDARPRGQRIGAVEDHCVAPVDRGGTHPHHDLMRARLRHRLLPQHQLLDASLLLKSIGLHLSPSEYVDRFTYYVDRLSYCWQGL